MERYDDAKGFKTVLTEDLAKEYAQRNGDITAVGYEEETMSYAPLKIIEEEPGFEDPGIRLKFEPYRDLNSRPQGKYKRVAVCNLITAGPMKVQYSGLFVNMNNKGEVFVHWPNAQYGNVNFMEVSYGGVMMSLSPLIVMAFFQWKESPDGEAVKKYEEEFLT